MIKIKKIINNPQWFFDSVDRKVSFVYGEIGLKKFSDILPKSNSLYWENILNRIRLAFCLVLVIQLILQIYELFLMDFVTNYGNINTIIRDLLLFVFWWSLFTNFFCFVVIDNFAKGKEKEKGNEEIQMVHMYYMFILPTLLVVGGCVVLWVS